GGLGCRGIGGRALPGPAACDPAGGEEESLFYHDQLRNLGFEPLGAVEETGYFLGFHYAKRFHHRVFVRRDLGVYASVCQLFPGGDFRVLLSTLLADGWFLQTGCCLESLVIRAERYYRWGVTTRVVREQLDAHLDLLRSNW